MDNNGRVKPWEEFETEYAKQFAKGMGAPAKSFRVVLGALIIKEILGISDRETVERECKINCVKVRSK